MLDLNLSVVNEENSTTIQMEENFADMDESGTSNSSIVNADANSSNAGECSSSSATATATLNFDILKVGGALGNNTSINATEERYQVDQMMTQSELVTRQLFPVNNNQGAGSSSVSNSLRSSPNWTTDLSFSQIQSQKQPALKKGRRGPRSRSSQYRGVTYYRRTGRWESHIWDCGKQVYLGID